MNTKVVNVSSAGSSIASIDQAIAAITAGRSNIGSIQNNLQYDTNYLSIINENQISAESKIRDADMAAAIMEYTQANLLQNFNIAIAAQANQHCGQVLRLLSCIG